MKTTASVPAVGSGFGKKSGLLRRWPILAAMGAVVALVLWWWQSADYSNDPQIIEIRKLQEQAQSRFASNGGPRNPNEAKEYVAFVETMRKKVEALPPHLRRAAFSGGQNFFFSSMRQRIDDYYAAPASQRQQILDRQIRQSDMMRTAFEEARKAREASNSTPATAQQQGTDRGRSRWDSRSQDERNNWFRDRILNRTSPEQRAKYVEYRRAASARREQLGLPEGWP